MSTAPGLLDTLMATKPHADNIRLKRIYAAPAREDGVRILVDRLWPRGVRKAAAALDEWAKEVAPSDALRKWYAHDPTRWNEFRRRYREELDAHGGAIERLRERARDGAITLLYAARDEAHCHALVLRDVLLGRKEP